MSYRRSKNESAQSASGESIAVGTGQVQVSLDRNILVDAF